MARRGALDALPELAAPLLARCRFPPPGTSVTCAVSGGPDSLALLALAVAAGCEVTAVHVDHQLRPGSADEALVAARAAAGLGVTLVTERVVVGAGPNLEARARAARHAVLPEGTLLGHTADDQADDRRPILALRRSDTVGLCAALGLDPVHDPSNDDPSIRRNRVRHEVLPLLAEVAGRDVVPVLARQAALLREAAELLAAEAGALDVTDAAALASAPPALARIAIRTWLRGCSAEGHPPDGPTVERVLAVARLDQRATDVGAGWRVARTEGRLRLVAPTTPAGPSRSSRSGGAAPAPPPVR